MRGSLTGVETKVSRDATKDEARAEGRSRYLIGRDEAYDAVLRARLVAGRESLTVYNDLSDQVLQTVPEQAPPELAQAYLTNIELLRRRRGASP